MKKTLNYGLVLLALGAVSLCMTPSNVEGEERVRKIRLSGELLRTAPRSVTIDDLEKLPATEYGVLDPYKKKPVTYSGVLVRDLVKEYAKPGVKKVRLRAIDEYTVEFVHSEWMRWDLMLATRSDGKRMSIKESGPARIVMPFDTAKDMDRAVYTPKWIWMVNKIEFLRE